MVMINNGFTYSEVAEHLGLTRNTVAGVVYRKKTPYQNRLASKRKEREQQKKRTKESVEAAYARACGRNKKSDIIKALLDEGGHRSCDIARELGCTKQLVSSIAKKRHKKNEGKIGQD